jgi:DNA-binding NarL/FixJ family response regulator
MGVKNDVYLVFLVEDDKFYLELLENYFSGKKNFKTVQFLTGEDCLGSLHLNPDLVILDYMLNKHDPNALDGKLVYKKIKEVTPNTRIIVVSGQQSADVVFNLVKEGVRNYIMKDSETFEQLDQLLEDYNLI